MRVLMMLAVLAVAVPDRPDPTPPKEKPRTLQEQLIGEWQLVMHVMGGRQDKKDDAVLIFTPTEIHVREKGRETKNDDATYRLDAERKPAGIDIMPKRGGDQKIEGILKIEGDVLTLCFNHGGGGERPTVFASTPQSAVALMQFRRIKK